MIWWFCNRTYTSPASKVSQRQGHSTAPSCTWLVGQFNVTGSTRCDTGRLLLLCRNLSHIFRGCLAIWVGTRGCLAISFLHCFTLWQSSFRIPRLARWGWQGVLAGQEKWRRILQWVPHRGLPLDQGLTVLVANVATQLTLQRIRQEFQPISTVQTVEGNRWVAQSRTTNSFNVSRW